MEEENKQTNKTSKTEKAKKIEKSSVGIDKKITFLVSTPLGHVILWIILFLVIIMLFIGLYTYLTSMPSIIRDRIVSWFRTVFTSGITDPAIDSITQEQLIDVGEYLESKGYDLENYGFAEEVTRKNQQDFTGQDLNEIKSNVNQTEAGTITQAEKGEIESLESTNLRAYIAAENRSYMIQDQNWNISYTTDRLTQIFVKTGKIDASYDEIYKVIYGLVANDSVESAEGGSPTVLIDLSNIIFQLERTFNVDLGIEILNESYEVRRRIC